MSPTPPAVFRHRDYWLLPLIGLLTIAVICVSVELLARTHFYESATGLALCLDDTDPARGVRGKPNTVCHEKSLESDDIEMRLDSKGYRSTRELGPKSADVYRIVLIGSSIAMGERAQLNDSPAALLAPRLSTLTGRNVEVYSQGMAWGFARNANLRFQDAIDAQPDLILWLVTPLDIARSEETLARVPDPAPPADGVGRFKYRILKYIRGHGGDIVFGQVLRHYLYEFQSEDQMALTLRNQSPDDESGFVFVTQSPAWQKHWDDFTGHAKDMISRAHAAGIPMAVTFAPNRIQAGMISAGEWPAGYDPYGIETGVKRRVEEDGGTFIGLLSYYGAHPGTEHFFLPIDGHPTPAGYIFLAEAIARQLTRGAVPALQSRAPASP